MLILYALIIILIFFISIIVLLFLLAEILAIFTTDAPFVPVPKNIEDEIIRNLRLTSNSILYDLGCGDGRILIKAVKRNPQMKAIGIERSFKPYLLAKFLTRKYKNIEIRRENIFKTDISEATHIFVYLFPEVIDRLFTRIKEQCKPGTRIVSCDFESKNYKPVEIISIQNNNKRGKKLFVYTI